MNFYCDLCLNSNEDNNNNINNANLNELISCALLDNYQLLAINITKKVNYIDDKNFKKNNIEINKDLIQNLYLKNSYKFLNVKKTELINWNKIKVLSRITLEISEQKDIFLITKNTNILKCFDIVTLKPKNDKILETILMSDINVDIINIDLYEKFNFMSKKNYFKHVHQKDFFLKLNMGNLSLIMNQEVLIYRISFY